MVFEQEESEEIGKVERPDSSDIVVRLVKWKGKWSVDIRNYVKTEKYTGFSPKGVFIPKEDYTKLMNLLIKAEERLNQK